MYSVSLKSLCFRIHSFCFGVAGHFIDSPGAEGSLGCIISRMTQQCVDSRHFGTSLYKSSTGHARGSSILAFSHALPLLASSRIREAPCSSNSPSVWFLDMDYRQILMAALTVVGWFYLVLIFALQKRNLLDWSVETKRALSSQYIWVSVWHWKWGMIFGA